MPTTQRSKYLSAGILAVALAAAGGCGDDEDNGEPTDGTASMTTDEADPDGDMSMTPDAPAEDVELFEFTVADGEAAPPLDRHSVDQGASVRIVVTSDEPDEVHLHGYDLAAAIGPGQDGVIEFTADQTGLFELETHESNLILLQLQVQ